MLLTLHLASLAMHVSPSVSRQFTHIPRWDRVLPRCNLGCMLPIVVRLVMLIRPTEPTTSGLILHSNSSTAMKPTTELPLVGSGRGYPPRANASACPEPLWKPPVPFRGIWRPHHCLEPPLHPGAHSV
jgi:hypothetical protein